MVGVRGPPIPMIIQAIKCTRTQSISSPKAKSTVSKLVWFLWPPCPYALWICAGVSQSTKCWLKKLITAESAI